MQIVHELQKLLWRITPCYSAVRRQIEIGFSWVSAQVLVVKLDWKLSWDFFCFSLLLKQANAVLMCWGENRNNQLWLQLMVTNLTSVVSIFWHPLGKFIYTGHKSITLLQVKCVRRGKINSVICFQLCEMLSCGWKWIIFSGPASLS